MDFSAANISLWNGMLQIAILSTTLVVANILRRKIPLIRKSLMPTAVLAGFLILIIRPFNLLNIDPEFLEMITYHCLGLGFIALALRVPEAESSEDRRNLTGVKSGALIASTYVIQGIVGLIISIGLAFTVMPGFFKAAGILLPMGYGQGPGQANNIGSTYEQLGFAGGQSFGLSIAAAGFLCACVVGVLYLNVLKRRGVIEVKEYDELSGSVTVEQFQSHNEIPMSESVDRLSMNVALVLMLYGLTYVVSKLLTAGMSATGSGLATTLNTLVWGFNFIIGTLLALLCRFVFTKLRQHRIMTRQYQNNYLLSRCSGLAFDLMVVAGIAAIKFEELAGLWLPFILMAITGGVVTFYYLKWLCARIYPNYFHAGFFSMFGMLTGTISSGVLLLREVDSDFATPAANNLLLGSSFAILFGAPILALVGLAPNSTAMALITLLLLTVYMVFLLLFMLKAKRR